ncbi:cytochrome D1 domain-containing protein [Terasakiella sp. A23]|uniref:cytochrome D1 domain-containing protein n=1 Tax=Terasakiella sp. FCG-A23 TaxID=3080561 RepID=UPI002952C188|nr:cytochrome D1 domain-containing protein [Terasakiella sp. A23]MDV7341282.1 cytochrome D1 domain-containing protein [Terasakiella sp. A23]
MLSFKKLRKFANAGLLCAALSLSGCVTSDMVRGTGDMGVVIERATGSVLVVDNTNDATLARVEGLGDLSHASIVYSRDARYAYVFGRDGGLSKIDILTQKLVKRVIQGGNSIGGAISQDGKLVAVSNYEPGGVRVFDADTLEMVADIPANDGSKTVGLADAPGNIFMVSLWDDGEIWKLDFSKGNTPDITKFKDVGTNPYDALISPDGRYYVAGLFGEDGLAKLDLWNEDKGVERILDKYGKGEKKLPVYKMPHLEGWAVAGDLMFLPAIGRHELLILNKNTWQEVGRIPVHGQPVFAMAQPGGKRIWVNFSVPNNDTIQVIDVQQLKVIKEMKPGKGVLHMEFTPRGEKVWMSVRDENRIDIYRTDNFEKVGDLETIKPSGIFFTDRAHKIGL